MATTQETPQTDLLAYHLEVVVEVGALL